MQEHELLTYLRQNPFVLAPMAGITDCAFRTFMREMGCGVVVTELVSATGLRFSSQRTRNLMRFHDVQRPIGIQIFGEELEHLAAAAQEIEQLGADFVDLNFGCPVPKVVKKGAGSAVLKDLVFLRDILRAVKSATRLPVTIKVRTGWDEASRNTAEVARIAYDEGITWVAIHGRTRAQGYAGLSDWDYIREIKAEAKLPILGNGDITTADLATRRLRESGCDGVLIGRGCLKNPWIFQEARAAWQGQRSLMNERDFPRLLSRLRDLVAETEEDRIVGLQLKKFAAWFSAGYPGSSQFRKQLFQSQSLNDTLQCIASYFGAMGATVQEDTSHEPFLMGGHG